MITNYLGFSIRIWVFAGNPDNDVHTSGGAYADVGELFMNTGTNELFVCTASGSGTQTWQSTTNNDVIQSIIDSIPQADWDQSDPGASNYIANKPSLSSPSQSSASRSLNSVFQISASRPSSVVYTVEIASALSLTSGQSGTVFLEIASDSGFTTDVQELGRFVNGNTGTLAIGLALTQTISSPLSGFVPSAYYVRLRTANNVGTPTFTYRSGQEVLL